MNCMDEFLLCPRCRGKTRIRVRTSTVLKDFPLSCPKCRYECIIDCEKGKVTAQRIQETQEAAPASLCRRAASSYHEKEEPWKRIL